MKGVSAVIAVILILMIVVALAALAYTWFTGIFSSLTTTAGESITGTTESMSKQFSIDAATCGSSGLSFTIRNTGTSNLTVSGVAAYVDNDYVLTSTTGTNDIAKGAVRTFTNTSSSVCGNTLKVTIENGVSNSIAL